MTPQQEIVEEAQAEQQSDASSTQDAEVGSISEPEGQQTRSDQRGASASGAETESSTEAKEVKETATEAPEETMPMVVETEKEEEAS
jgi:hypothetical protein